MGRARAVLFLLTSLLAAACASAGGGGSSGDPDVITSDQFAPSDQTALVIVQRLRPRWLRARSQGTVTNPEPAFAQVYVDNTHVGDIDSLYRISATQIDRIEYLDALDATTRYGTGYAGGLIIVRTINSRP